MFTKLHISVKNCQILLNATVTLGTGVLFVFRLMNMKTVQKDCQFIKNYF